MASVVHVTAAPKTQDCTEWETCMALKITSSETQQRADQQYKYTDHRLAHAIRVCQTQESLNQGKNQAKKTHKETETDA